MITPPPNASASRSASVTQRLRSCETGFATTIAPNSWLMIFSGCTTAMYFFPFTVRFTVAGFPPFRFSAGIASRGNVGIVPVKSWTPRAIGT